MNLELVGCGDFVFSYLRNNKKKFIVVLQEWV